MTIMDGAKVVTSLAAFLGIVFGAINYVDSVALTAVKPIADRVTTLEERLTLNELNDLLRRALENLYFYRDQVRKYPGDQDLQDRLFEARKEVEDLKGRIKNLEEQGDN